MSTLLEVENLSAGYKRLAGIRDLSFNLARGEAIAFLGPNGAGKTTAVEAVLGLVDKLGGSVRLNGKDITNAKPSFLVKSGLSLVPQWRDLFPAFTIDETIEAARVGSGRTSAFDNAMLFDLFPPLRARSEQGVRASMLSGGEQQMLAIARALATGPDLLIVDEMSIGLSVGIANTLVDTLARIRESGLSLIVVEQNTSLAERLAMNCILLEAGRPVWRGKISEARHTPEFDRAYFGDATVRTKVVHIQPNG